MKSLGLVVAAIITSATMSIASANNASSNVESQNVINFEKLSHALNLTPSQVNQVFDINSDFEVNMSASNTDKRVKKSIYSNLAQMKDVLSEKQYLRYVALVNLTENNRTTVIAGEEGNFAQK
jgi:hypothetical protein